MPDPSLFQSVVKLVVRSELIHVAVLPVFDCEYLIEYYSSETSKKRGKVLLINAHPKLYTAFMKIGVITQPAQEVFNGSYALRFVPVRCRYNFQAGLRFLQDLEGAEYNTRALLIAALPMRIKRAWHFPSILSQETQDQLPFMGVHPSVFCSQMCLMLCYMCNILKDNRLDPAACAPADLLQALDKENAAIVCGNDMQVFTMGQKDYYY